MRDDEKLTILGGNIAALAAAYYGQRAGVASSLYAPEKYWGGINATIQSGKYFFDLDFQCIEEGDPRQIDELRTLLGRDWVEVAPVLAFQSGASTLQVPGAVPQMVWRAGPAALLASGLQVAATSWIARAGPLSLRRALRARYGTPLSVRFLAEYFRRVFEVSWSEIDARAAGRCGWPHEPARWTRKKSFYPAFGIGEVANKLAEGCESKQLVSGVDLVRVMHSGKDVQGIELGRGRRHSTDQLYIALPITQVVQLFDPAPPEAVLRAARAVRHRSKLLITVIVDRAKVTDAGCIYFVEPEDRIARLFEPKNMSPFAAPLKNSALVAEIWCNPMDSLWQTSDADLEVWVGEELERRGIIGRDEIIACQVTRLTDVMPVPDFRYAGRVAKVAGWLSQFKNLKFFQPETVADGFSVVSQIKQGRELVQQLQRERDEARLLSI